MSKIAPLYSQQEIENRIREIAHDISVNVTSDNLLVIGLLKGAYVFTADLVRALDLYELSPQVEFLRVSSYGNRKESSGHVDIIGGLPDQLTGKTVLLVDDILDTGRTAYKIKSLLLENGVKSVNICVLLDKPSKHVKDIEADYVGFEIADSFVVGYGIDYAEKYRHLPYIGMLNDD